MVLIFVQTYGNSISCISPFLRHTFSKISACDFSKFQRFKILSLFNLIIQIPCVTSTIYNNPSIPLMEGIKSIQVLEPFLLFFRLVICPRGIFPCSSAICSSLLIPFASACCSASRTARSVTVMAGEMALI